MLLGLNALQGPTLSDLSQEHAGTCPEMVETKDRHTSQMKETSSRHDWQHLRRENEAKGAVFEPLMSGTRRRAVRPAPRPQASLHWLHSIMSLTLI